ncbi:MAG: thioredoxin family protein [Saprospiraceae bacterium]
MFNKVFSILTFSIIAAAFLSFKNAEPLQEQVEVKWYTWEEAVEASKTEERKVFVDIYTDWCGWCKRMDKNTFSHKSVAKYLNDDFYAVKLNAEQRQDIIFKGHTFKYMKQGRRGYHQLAYELMNGRMSYPTVVVLNEDFERIFIAPGYQEAKDFEYVLRFASEDHYKTKKWQAFLNEEKK